MSTVGKRPLVPPSRRDKDTKGGSKRPADREGESTLEYGSSRQRRKTGLDQLEALEGLIESGTLAYKDLDPSGVAVTRILYSYIGSVPSAGTTAVALDKVNVVFFRPDSSKSAQKAILFVNDNITEAKRVNDKPRRVNLDEVSASDETLSTKKGDTSVFIFLDLPDELAKKVPQYVTKLLGDREDASKVLFIADCYSGADLLDHENALVDSGLAHKVVAWKQTSTGGLVNFVETDRILAYKAVSTGYKIPATGPREHSSGE